MLLYQWAINSSPEAIFCIDLNNCFLSFNKAAENLYGLEDTHTLGNPFNLFLDNHVITNSQQKIEFLNLFQNVLKGIPLSNLKMNCLNKKSRIIKASACAYPIFNNENMIIGMLVTLKHNVDSEVSNNAYLKNYQDLEAFSHMACHDLKSPLRGINFLIHIMAEQLKELRYTKVDTYLAKISKNIYKLSYLIDNIFYYLQFPHQNNDVEAVDSCKLIKNIIEILDKPENCVFELDPSLSVITTSKLPLQHVFQAIINTIINRLNTSKDTHIIIKQKDYEKETVFFIQDQKTPAVRMENHEKNSEYPLYCDDTVCHGTDLAIAKKIIQSQGGDIEIKYSQDFGDSVIFTWKKN